MSRMRDASPFGQPGFFGAAQIVPTSNVGPNVAGGPPPGQWGQNQGQGGPAYPPPGAPTSGYPSSPNYGAAAPQIKVGQWTGSGSWVYELFSDGTIRVASEPSGKHKGLILIPGAANHAAVVREYLSMFPKGAYVSFLTGGTGVAPTSTVASIVSSITGSAPPAAMVPMTSTAMVPAPTTGMSTGRKVVFGLGSAAVVLAIGGGLYLYWRSR